MNTGQKIKILIVDDTPDIVYQLQQILISEGYEVFVAINGEKALERLNHNIPDLILLDIIMPGIDGYETCRRIKSNSDFEKIPIVFMSALLETFDKVKAFSYGAVDYITKPLNTEELLVRIKTHISISQLQKELLEANVRLEEKVKQRTHELEESEAKYRNLFENSQEGIWVIDKNNFTTIINPAMAKMLGFKLKDIIGKNIFDFIDSQEKSAATDYISKIKNGISAQHDFEFIKKDGTKLYATCETAPLTDENGKYIGAIAGMIDITARKIAEIKLIEKNNEYESLNEELKQINESLILSKEKAEESEKNFITLFNSGNDAIFVHSLEVPDKSGNFINVNDTACKRYGYTKEEFLKISLEQLDYKEAYLKYTIPAMEKLKSGESNLTFETIHKTKSGQKIPAEINSSVFDMHDKKMIISIARDITERKLAEKALIISEENYRNIFNSSTEAIFIHDVDTGKLIDVNHAMLKMYGYEDKQTVLVNKFECFSANTDIYTEEVAQNLLKKAVFEGSQTFEWYARKKDGTLFWIEMNLKKTKLGGNDRILAVGRDINERKKADEEIKKLNNELEQRVKDRTAKLEEAYKEQESFSYSISHDLRAPLRSMCGFSQILLQDYKDMLDDNGKHYLDVINKNSIRMAQLIDDLLAFSKLIREKINKTKINTKTLVNSVYADISTVTDVSKVKFKLLDLPESYADASMIKQVWYNLISNAIKFSSKKETPFIEIGFNEATDETIYYIKDNGDGFDMNYYNKLFGVFQRLHSEKEFLGTGVGLANVKRILQKHNGRIWAEGKKGEGATFYFTLPKV